MEYKATLETLEHGLSGEIDKTYIYSSPFLGNLFIFLIYSSNCMLFNHCHLIFWVDFWGDL
ncbi:hypothetical protein ACJIZ3_012824 [Penstemon smallii]|uniref:Uncharacterized protein n=1 Tax=Penstemon smallii TaxID=265156 RepID=A0ABD3URP9_9LAMI